VLDLIALISIALLFSAHQIAIRKGTSEGEVITGTFVSLATTSAIFLVLSLNRLFLDPAFIGYMIAAGILHFLIARTAFYTCIDRIGANLAAPLAATRVYFAALFGILFFDEALTPKLILMSTLIFAGIVLLSNPARTIKTDILGIALGIFTGFTASLSSVMVKAGMTIHPDPVFGSAIGYLASLALFPALAGKKIRYDAIDLDHYKYFIIGGIFVGAGHYLRYYELARLPVSVVEPVLSTYPLFTFLLSYIFIRNIETFSLRTILGAICIIGGINIYFFA